MGTNDRELARPVILALIAAGSFFMLTMLVGWLFMPNAAISPSEAAKWSIGVVFSVFAYAAITGEI